MAYKEERQAQTKTEKAIQPLAKNIHREQAKSIQGRSRNTKPKESNHDKEKSSKNTTKMLECQNTRHTKTKSDS